MTLDRRLVSGMRLPLSSWYMVFSCGERGLLAVVDESSMAVMGTQQQEASAAEVAGRGMDDGKSKAGCNSGVDGVATGAQDLQAGVGGKMVDADYHAVLGPDWLLGKIGNHVFGTLQCGDVESGEAKCGAGEDGMDGERVPSSHGVLTG
jgi:hypothetical protein